MTDTAYSVESQQLPQRARAWPQPSRWTAIEKGRSRVCHLGCGASAFVCRALFVIASRAARRALAQLERELAGLALRLTRRDSRPQSHALGAARSCALIGALCAPRSPLYPASARLIARLPRVLFDAGRDEPRVAAIARVYLSAVDGDFSAPTFLAFIQALQAHEPLTFDELWNIAAFLQFVAARIAAARRSRIAARRGNRSRSFVLHSHRKPACHSTCRLGFSDRATHRLRCTAAAGSRWDLREDGFREPAALSQARCIHRPPLGLHRAGSSAGCARSGPPGRRPGRPAIRACSAAASTLATISSIRDSPGSPQWWVFTASCLAPAPICARRMLRTSISAACSFFPA